MELLEPYKNFIYLAGVVLVLLILAWMVIRTFGKGVRAKRGARLGISEYYEVDKSKFLVLLRRDNVEHLVLVGGNQDIVIETGIGAQAAAERARPETRLSPEDLDIVGKTPSATPLRPATMEPELSASSPEAGMRPISTRAAPRPPLSPEQASDRTPNLRAVERDPI